MIPMILLIACLLLFAVPVGAEERMFSESDVKAATVNVMKRVAEQTRHDRNCLARMEEAMRAMDKFVTYGLSPGRVEDIPERVRAIDLWNSVKRECWKKP